MVAKEKIETDTYAQPEKKDYKVQKFEEASEMFQKLGKIKIARTF